ncbi:hypothetical protein [Amnibacterium kyonggiense]|uniref:Protein involved in plasmid replication-relaxation n=1 Tax=Amnibacterium kyonggiense TaxID=595671 RepID=A0A4R7FPQ2_9MICO|nr:hypothetical protein [Amnibacterium kyonggiense]TDS79730.1 hypothetical protein CLV52_0270 [Amnibacterium kyonggiense]
MVQIRGGTERRVWVVPRDEAMFGWFRIVRIADVQAVRWVLGALNGTDRPVSTRRAQEWVVRMEAAGLVERVQLGGRGGSLVFGTYAATGQGRPGLYRQTTRHEVAVAATSARYAAAGYSWRRDDKPDYAGGHQADGVAESQDWAELIEVELTGKRLPRYAQIFTAFRRRFDAGEMDQVTYICSDEAAQTVRAATNELPVGRTIAPQVQIQPVFDPLGHWADDALPSWMLTARNRAADDATSRSGGPRPSVTLF